MEIIDYSLEWARGEVFSSKVIALISVFLIVVAGGLYYANHPRIMSFQEQY